MNIPTEAKEEKTMGKVTIQEVAERMNGREYLHEITPEEEKELKEAGIVVAFGYSDDNVELRGAIDEEIGAYEHAFIQLYRGKILAPCCVDGGYSTKCPLFMDAMKQAKTIDVYWKNGIWQFDTAIPHEVFTIKEDGEAFGDGIAFYLKDVDGEA